MRVKTERKSDEVNQEDSEQNEGDGMKKEFYRSGEKSALWVSSSRSKATT